MAILSVKEIWQGRDGSSEISKSGSSVRRYSRTFRVVTNSRYDEATIVTASASLPLLGEAYPTDAAAYCRRLRPRNESFSPYVWVITYAYSTEREIAENPLNDPPLIVWGNSQHQKVFDNKIGGGAVENTAGLPFDPPHMIPDATDTVSITANVATAPLVPAWWRTYTGNPINNAAIVIEGQTIKTQAAMLSNKNLGSVQTRNDVDFKVMTLTLMLKGDDQVTINGAAKNDDWRVWLLSQGYQQKVGGVLVDLVDDDNKPIVGQLWPLDVNGAQIAVPTPANGYFQEFPAFTPKAFTVFPGVTAG